ncbi:recombinase family protein [Acetobacter pasteurianus]|uniref:recombinase family protein n=1 Tax=Acetobacter pasteurianus TaxID=438 RepID=UPI0009BBF858|nr:recombinase family protein [Acetobacter pasteurianus]
MAQQIGYARVSTIGQTLDTQIQVLGRFGCAKIFREKASGATACRQLSRMMIEANCTAARKVDFSLS